MEQYIPKSALEAEIEKLDALYHTSKNLTGDLFIQGLFCFIDTLEAKEVTEKSETAYGSKIIKVKCISPFDETWEKGKIYTGEKWHHGDLNMDFWDIYYDYGSNPKYVQFSSFEMLEKEFVVLKNDILEVKKVDLEKELIEWHKKHFKKDGTFIGMSGFYLTNNSQMDIAKHFFELGMQVSNKA